MKLGAGFFIICPSTAKVLVVFRNDPEPTWSIFGGGLEKYESSILCAKRELLEEANFMEDKDYQIPSTRPAHIGTYNHFVYRTYIATVSHEITPILNYEHSQFRWVSLDDIPYPRHFGLVNVLLDEKFIKKLNSYLKS